MATQRIITGPSREEVNDILPEEQFQELDSDGEPINLSSPVEGRSETIDNRGITPLPYLRLQPTIPRAHYSPIHTRSRGLDGIQLRSGKVLPTSH